VKAFLDTSVLIATFYGDHVHHAASLDLLLRYGRRNTCCSADSLAEVYAVLTAMPGRRRVGGDAALLFLSDIRRKLSLVWLDEESYFRAFEEAAERKLDGRAIHDALLVRCARKADAETLYTWNTKDFLRLPSATADFVKQPDQLAT